jgi:predicted DNA-binding protein
MPNQTRSKRLPLSLNPEITSVLDDLSELQNKPKSRIVNEILEQALPQLILMRDSLQAVKDGMNPQEVVQNILKNAQQMVQDFDKENNK